MLCNLEVSPYVCHCLLRIKVALLCFAFEEDTKCFVHTTSNSNFILNLICRTDCLCCHFGSDESSPFVQTMQSMSSISTLVAIVMAQAKNNAKRLMYSSCQFGKGERKTVHDILSWN